jgi:hypothetical protein
VRIPNTAQPYEEATKEDFIEADRLIARLKEIDDWLVELTDRVKRA